MAYTSNKKINGLDSAVTPLGAGNEIILSQAGNTVKANLASVESKIFDAKTAMSNPTGSEVVVVRQIDNNLRQVALTDIVPALNITNAKVSASAAIADTKLATIATAGKVLNSATTATSANTINAIVARDGSGNFAAGAITATLSGNASTASVLQTGRTIALTGDVTATTGAFNGSGNVSAAATIANNAVTTAKILDANVTTAKIADDAVITAKILNSNVTTAKIADGAVTQDKLNSNVILVPPGAIMPFAKTSAPTGWLAANGQTIGSASSGATFANAIYEVLYAILWLDWGQALLPLQTSAGVVTPRGISAAADWAANRRLPLPDLRDNFIRGSGGTLAPTFGAFQDYQVHNHTHSGTTGVQSADHTHFVSGTTGTDYPDHAHGFNDYYQANSGQRINAGTGAGWQDVGAFVANTTFGANARHQHSFSATTSGMSASHTHTITTGNPSVSAGSETRPRNIALLYCIKF